jgi:hypothetical protein
VIPALIGPAPDIRDTTRDAAWHPVTVTAFLADPVIGPGLHPVHLDGPLAWAAYLAWSDVHGACALPPPGETVTDFSLPLATWTSPAPPGADPAVLTGDGLAWGWACSRAIIPASAEGTVNVRKPPALAAAARYSSAASWDLSSGPHKARDTPYPVTLAPVIMWHALADPAALRALLIRVTGIGKLTRHGHGRVRYWRVEDGPPAGWTDRVLPQQGGAPGRIRAPYWHRSREMPCTP